ncbi:MAG: PEP-CTERM sorting domain-containing protein [Cyanomargarita calcarea GSE-NOS-MK-12-04C]|jgi:hypothetical protein|uniref:PEP-CTERM sorting domain-containing protein n=1 Tax=Cyanomargarita calcarea GSE-NOS-MK-12-04C TaxID=2839659 RepID=A0A951UVL0_9CYAN|nr:PEP-CTERM sorting domain-containing protein [Cyanomargarita calcarea GSE-NOS-MK-12-04C]
MLSFINKHKSFIVLGLAVSGLFIAPNQVKAFNPVDRTNLTDTEFEDILRKGEFTESFVAEGRIGNNGLGGNGEQEFGINTPITPKPDGTLTDATTIAKGDRTWVSGSLVDFALEYTGSQINYTVGEQLLSNTSFSGEVTDIFLRTFAQRDSTDGSNSNKDNFVGLSNLLLFEKGTTQGKTINSLSSSGATTSDTDYAQLSGISSGFKLTGKAAMSWAGTTPSRSNLAYQIKVGNTPQKRKVPEPGMLGAIFVAGLVGARYSKRNKAAIL